MTHIKYNNIILSVFFVLTIAGCEKKACNNQLTVSGYPGTLKIKPPYTSFLVVKVEIPPGTNIYANPKGPGIGKPTTIKPVRTPFVKFGSPGYLPGKKYIYPNETEHIYIYETETFIFLPFSIDPKAAGGKLTVAVKFEAILCRGQTCELKNKTINYQLILTDNEETSYSEETMPLYHRAMHRRSELEKEVTN